MLVYVIRVYSIIPFYVPHSIAFLSLDPLNNHFIRSLRGQLRTRQWSGDGQNMKAGGSVRVGEWSGKISNSEILFSPSHHKGWLRCFL